MIYKTTNSQTDNHTAGHSKAKAKYYLKYYVRLGVLALILYVIIRNQFAQPIALIVGLSTVVCSICFTVASVARQYFSAAEEA